jgi:hypothetical protein
MVSAASWLGSRERRPSAFIQSGQRRLGNQMLAGLAFDVPACGILAQREVIDREREQPEVIVVRAVAARRARTTITRSVEVVDRLLEAFLVCVPAGAFRKPDVLARDVIGRPMMPGARGRVRVVTEKDEASGLRRGAGPLERRGKVFTIASEAPRDRCTVYKGA